jgi:hypothetical protein
MAPARVEQAPTWVLHQLLVMERGCTPCASGPYFPLNRTCVSASWFTEFSMKAPR